MKLNLVAFFVLVTFSNIKAQKFNINGIPIDHSKYKFLKFHNSKYIFKAGQNTLFFVDSKDFSRTYAVTYDFEEVIQLNECRYIEGKLLYLKSKLEYNNIEERKANGNRTNQVEIYLFDLESGKLTQSEKIKYNHSKYSLIYEVDSVLNKILIGVTDTVIKVFNFDLTISSTEGFKMKSTSPENDYESDFLRQFGMRKAETGEKKITYTNPRIDATSIKRRNYYINYDTHKDTLGNYYFVYFTSINVATDISEFEYDVEISSEKKVINIDYQELENGNLLLYGKYIQMAGPMEYYGFFSVVIDKNLKLVHELKYFEITQVNLANLVFPYDRYVGLALADLSKPDYSFYMKEEKVRIMTYQYEFYNYLDHIYIVKLHDNGEIIVNIIVNQIFDVTFRARMFCGYSAFLSDGKIHFLFYDNIKNLNKAANDPGKSEIVEMKKKETILTSCYYDIKKDEFSSKIKVADKYTLPNFLMLKGSSVAYNNENNTYTHIVFGKNKKGYDENLYFINYTW